MEGFGLRTWKGTQLALIPSNPWIVRVDYRADSNGGESLDINAFKQMHLPIWRQPENEDGEIQSTSPVDHKQPTSRPMPRSPTTGTKRHRKKSESSDGNIGHDRKRHQGNLEEQDGNGNENNDAYQVDDGGDHQHNDGDQGRGQLDDLDVETEVEFTVTEMKLFKSLGMGI
ncbi:unnamed protein product [Fusarium graminearum]|uniref:Uncharacterized protein n=1 Tax=Gibberella zeae TaxID=5518 RepID=A0A4U9ETF1_GIBZA|nr:unnamed protein product [Fusarium graminearum]CAF3516442.1 unnamed protein product [Fusarium graminearum]CAF3534180.1 unnamed protein product [Fusarium graminearum]CAG1967238.1 unnamed protein product [Fusarium graminearum]CAG1969372.1 unnamed protein product [Fusarium graminearum]